MTPSYQDAVQELQLALVRPALAEQEAKTIKSQHEAAKAEHEAEAARLQLEHLRTLIPTQTPSRTAS